MAAELAVPAVHMTHSRTLVVPIVAFAIGLLIAFAIALSSGWGSVADRTFSPTSSGVADLTVADCLIATPC